MSTSAGLATGVSASQQDGNTPALTNLSNNLSNVAMSRHASLETSAISSHHRTSLRDSMGKLGQRKSREEEDWEDCDEIINEFERSVVRMSRVGGSSMLSTSGLHTSFHTNTSKQTIHTME